MTEGQQQYLKVEFIYSKVVNYALQQNHVPIIRRLFITNISEGVIQNLIIELNFEPDFSLPVSTRIESLQPGESFLIDNLDIKISAKYLSELTERIAASIIVSIQSDQGAIFRNEYDIDILAFDQWQGIAVLPEIISSFITPNNPEISNILSSAAQTLNTWTGSPSFDEYQSRNPDRVKKQMAAIFESIRKLDIVYCAPPASFEESGQRIRLIDTLISQRIGTCLDMSLMYASCLEAVGIHSFIIVIKGHAFSGGWLIDDSFPDSINDDPSLLSKRIVDGIHEVLLVESTFMNAGNSGSFDDAVRAANYHLAKTDDFLLFVDVKRSRFAGIRPLPQRIMTDRGWEFADDNSSAVNTNAPEEIVYDGEIENFGDKEISKQQLWERKLLDLSLRNNLLNTRITKSTVQLISVSLNKLEDALAAGDEFQLWPKPTDWDNPLRKAGVYQAINQSDPIIDLVKSELSQKRLRTYLSENELVHGLTNLYRSSKLSLEENGANTLYLCLGLLKWFETPASELPRFSPILLLPVEIIRKSASKGFVIRSREEETLMNITLLEMLRHDFKITIPGLDPLPRDESGVDVKKIFNIIRQALMMQDRWDVEEQAILGTFSFNKFIMWNDIHNNADKLVQNKIVASLVSGKAQWDVDLNQFASEDLDKKYHPAQIALPISADSSQLESICAAGQDKSFILHGPPGTGKSQTITNIIANALYNGKKVLFVAEKMAALSVVQKRLDAIGIAPFCLELHSNKSKKSSVLEQFKRTTEITRKSSPGDFQSEADRINQLRNELNGYVEALHKIYPFGFSLFDAFSGYASLPAFDEQIHFETSLLSSLSKEQVIVWTELAEELKVAGMMCGQPYKHPLGAIESTQYSAQIKSDSTLLFDKYLNVLNNLKTSTAEALKILNQNIVVNQQSQASDLNKIIKILVNSADIPASLLCLDNLTEAVNRIILAAKHAFIRNKNRDSLRETFSDNILALDAEKLKVRWITASEKWVIPKIYAQSKIIRILKQYAVKGKIKKAIILNTLDQIIEYQHEQKYIDQQSEFLASVLGSRWQGGEGDWHEIENTCITVLELNESLFTFTLHPDLSVQSRQNLAIRLKEGHNAFLLAYKFSLNKYLEYFNEFIEIENNLKGLLNINFNNLEAPAGNFLEDSLINCSNWRSNIDSLRDWVGWNQIKEKAIGQGLSVLVNSYVQGKVQGKDVVHFFLKSLYRSCADYIISQDTQLSAFNGKLFEQKIHKFQQLNKQFEKLTQDELYARLASRVPLFSQEAAQSSEIGILQRNIRNGGRGMSIRKLFDTIPNLLTRLCPCMLMSPISVAQYLDVNNFKFDLIVFDEASQMPTCESVGAIARGNNLIVVGDPKQMPPTNFFSSNNIDEENMEKEDLESILDDCLALSLPSKHLLWHYRSKHESLITFSNTQYYENSLLTFPSPDDLTTRVKFVHVKGYYDRGKSRQNSFEAKAVIDEILSRLSDPELSGKSIGVVTFSSAQQILIDDMLTEAFKSKPDLELVATESPEPIFIKNLENVQGDERDVILFSVGYGPDKDNKVNLNFGPINREGGWRRLNVAVSRARYEMKVFSTLTADQIDITRTASLGVAGLKAFLDFAEKGKSSFSVINGKNRAQSNSIAEEIAEKLVSEGYAVDTNIGCSGFKIDLAVHNPVMPSEYLLGILCDGHNYKESKTAKDREIIQSDVLNLLGWNIHKVWSCDWWDNQVKVLEEIKQAIKNTQNPDNNKKEPSPEQLPVNIISSQPASSPVVIENPIAPSKYKLDYQTYILPMRSYISEPDMLWLNYFRNTVNIDVDSVLQNEAPISREMLIRRVLTAWSVTRIGSRIDAYFNDLFDKMGLKFTKSGKRFYWYQDQVPETYQFFRVPVNESDKRDASDIPPEEISNAIREILENQISLDRADLIREVAHTFGFSRIGGNVDSCMQAGIEKAIQRGFAKAEGTRIIHSD